jgi:hypothetical protein
MKTSDSIEQQPERKAARDNGDSSPISRPPVSQKLKQRDATRIASWRWKPGQSGNPTGKAGRNDLAAEIARAVFESQPEALFKAFSKALLRGNAYAFKELADRAFGRLKERIEVDRGPYADMSEQDLQQRVRELEDKLGVPHAEPKILSPASDDSDSKPN